MLGAGVWMVVRWHCCAPRDDAVLSSMEQLWHLCATYFCCTGVRMMLGWRHHLLFSYSAREALFVHVVYMSFVTGRLDSRACWALVPLQ